MFSFILGGGTYKEDKFEEDAVNVQGYYRDRGYIAAQVGQPELRILEDEKDGKTRWVQLRVPGHRRGPSTASASSNSKATRSSSPRPSRRCSS